MIRRFLAVLKARNLEFLRDRSALGWNIALPVFIVLGMWLVFSGNEKPIFKVAVFSGAAPLASLHNDFLSTRFIQFYSVSSIQPAIRKVEHDQSDMLLDLENPAHPRYWVNQSSPKGYILEKILQGEKDLRYTRQPVSGRAIRYVDWLIPGILGMNMMFSCLFGVGYVIVRYRKNGFLKRLNATPLHAFEFIAAQVTSRLILIMCITIAVYIGTDLLIGFYMSGSYLALLLVAILGATSMISLGLLVAARVSSEEFAGGLLNLLSWPMMFLSGVWFSLQGTHPWLQRTAEFLPLTQLLEGARAVMLDGAGVLQILPQLLALAGMTIVFLAVGAASFKWKND
ncbi:MAG: ABC transporter permease [Gammaproteobacteria bacterium]|nr:ABC transporter permease [Gammaproteobacteria bacterium]MDE2345032.1 ABC transporter permease [Gammaproteobacteria bacterium]